MLLCIDLGNTHTHFAILDPADPEARVSPVTVPTGSADHPTEGIYPAARRWIDAGQSFEAVAFCSVVPAANVHLRRALEPLGVPIWQLTAAAELGVAITYPRPEEIGHDRLANAAAASQRVGAPAVVIDLGTAVTFDVVTRAGGYEGGIIAPGPALMARYLHERTAQLPLVEDWSSPVVGAIGKSTVEAMRIGAVIGFAGMIEACLEAVLAELAGRGEPEPTVLTTGGAAALLAGRLRRPTVDAPDLTLHGVAAAWQLSAARDQ